MEHSFKDLIEYVKGRRVYVQTHNFPDPDAIGSGFGLQELLGIYGVESTLCYSGKIDRVNTQKMIELLEIDIYSKEELEEEMDSDAPIILVDSQKGAGNVEDLVGDEIAAIDHHPTVRPIEYYYKDVQILGSCATIVAGYYDEFGIKPGRMAATAMLYGLHMDTDGFSRGVKEKDIRAFEFLHKYADLTIIDRLLHSQMELKDLRAYGAAISNITVFDRVGIAYMSFPCPDALIAITCDFLLSLDVVELAIVYSKREDGYKFSVRGEENTKQRLDCGRIIAKALEGIGSGGGHSFMAGGFIPLEAVQQLGDEPDRVLKARLLHAISEEV